MGNPHLNVLLGRVGGRLPGKHRCRRDPLMHRLLGTHLLRNEGMGKDSRPQPVGEPFSRDEVAGAGTLNGGSGGAATALPGAANPLVVHALAAYRG